MEAVIRKRGTRVRRTRGDAVFDTVNVFIWIIILIVILYPLWIILITSVSSAEAINAGQVVICPIDFSLIGYEAIFAHDQLIPSYLNNVLYTVAGTALSLVVTLMAAYSLTMKFSGRRLINFYFIFTMFFNGGLVPQFLINQALGLYNTVLLMIIINCVSVWNLMITRTYIATSVPSELYEAAVMDGANHFTYFFKVVLPLSGTIIAVLCVYYGVARWNDYFTALIYLRDEDKMPLQYVLRQMIASANAGTSMDSLMNFFGSGQVLSDAVRKAEVVKYCAIVISTGPVIFLYLFMQKYFVKGVTLGSLKG